MRYIDADWLWNDRPRPKKTNDARYMAGFNDCMSGFGEIIGNHIVNYSADVVPKSEAEALQAEIDRLQKHNTEYARKHYDDGYNTAKSEVAREIFEDITKNVFSKIPNKIYLINNEQGYSDGVIIGKREAFFEMIEIIAELKKKYTEV